MTHHDIQCCIVKASCFLITVSLFQSFPYLSFLLLQTHNPNPNSNSNPNPTLNHCYQGGEKASSGGITAAELLALRSKKVAKAKAPSSSSNSKSTGGNKSSVTK
jgi:hypothetical protein